MVYAPQNPYDEGFLQVSDIHNIYYMQCGNPQGKPVLFLHGGPGGSIGPTDMVYFNPEVYRVIAFSQRGAGKSTPTADLRENTTWDLVADIEKLRTHVNVDKWLVFGGSWGSTLSLAYSQTHPDKCKGLILRGIFLLRRAELQFFYQEGTSWFWPEEWRVSTPAQTPLTCDTPSSPKKLYSAPALSHPHTSPAQSTTVHFAQIHLAYADHQFRDKYLSVLPESERGDIISAYYRLLTHPDDNVSLKAAQEWSRWEYSTSTLRQDPENVAKADVDIKWARAFARIECHYFVNQGFMPDGHLITEEQIAKIRHLPIKVVQGRYDCVCPARSAYDLKKAWGKGLELSIVDDAGHSAKEAGIAKLLAKAADEFAAL